MIDCVTLQRAMVKHGISFPDGGMEHFRAALGAMVNRFVLHAAPTANAAPVAQGDALPREDFAWMVVQEACETEPADEDDPECIRILRIDLKSAVLAAFLRLDAARAQAKEGASHG